MIDIVEQEINGAIAGSKKKYINGVVISDCGNTLNKSSLDRSSRSVANKYRERINNVTVSLDGLLSMVSSLRDIVNSQYTIVQQQVSQVSDQIDDMEDDVPSSLKDDLDKLRDDLENLDEEGKNILDDLDDFENCLSGCETTQTVTCNETAPCDEASPVVCNDSGGCDRCQTNVQQGCLGGQTCDYETQGGLPACQTASQCQSSGETFTCWAEEQIYCPTINDESKLPNCNTIGQAMATDCVYDNNGSTECGVEYVVYCNGVHQASICATGVAPFSNHCDWTVETSSCPTVNVDWFGDSEDDVVAIKDCGGSCENNNGDCYSTLDAQLEQGQVCLTNSEALNVCEGPATSCGPDFVSCGTGECGPDFAIASDCLVTSEGCGTSNASCDADVKCYYGYNSCQVICEGGEACGATQTCTRGQQASCTVTSEGCSGTANCGTGQCSSEEGCGGCIAGQCSECVDGNECSECVGGGEGCGTGECTDTPCEYTPCPYSPSCPQCYKVEYGGCVQYCQKTNESCIESHCGTDQTCQSQAQGGNL